MRTDPRAACENAEERLLWAILHDAVCHPLMAITGYSAWSVRFHDWTSFRAWPRKPAKVGATTTVPSRHHGDLQVTEVQPGFFSVHHPVIRHRVVTSARDPLEAVEMAEQWFDSLADVGIYPSGTRP